jgi:hypothetical protein
VNLNVKEVSEKQTFFLFREYKRILNETSKFFGIKGAVIRKRIIGSQIDETENLVSIGYSVSKVYKFLNFPHSRYYYNIRQRKDRRQKRTGRSCWYERRLFQ